MGNTKQEFLEYLQKRYLNGGPFGSIVGRKIGDFLYENDGMGYYPSPIDYFYQNENSFLRSIDYNMKNNGLHFGGKMNFLGYLISIWINQYKQCVSNNYMTIDEILDLAERK